MPDVLVSVATGQLLAVLPEAAPRGWRVTEKAEALASVVAAENAWGLTRGN